MMLLLVVGQKQLAVDQEELADDRDELNWYENSGNGTRRPSESDSCEYGQMCAGLAAAEC